MGFNSHIQLPRFILNYFKCSDGKVRYLGLSDYRIHSTSPKILGTQENYFSRQMEQYLSREIEHPFSCLVSEVNAFVEHRKDRIDLSLEMEKIAKRYITAAFSRSKRANSIFLEESLTAFLCDDQKNHDDLVFISTRINSGILPEIETARIMVLLNLTERQFVLPRNCFYVVSSNGIPCIVAPITPVCAIALTREDFPAEEDARLWIINDSDDIWHMNKHAFCMEYAFNHEFVVSASKSELLQLKTFAEDNQEMLDYLRSSLME